MLYICSILGLIALALAFPVPGHHRSKDVALPVWPFTMESCVEVGCRSYGHETTALRSAISFDLADDPLALGTTLAIRKSLVMPSSAKQIAPRPASNISPKPISSLYRQSQWSPGDISNVLFGCITSILGVLAVVVTYYLSRRRLQGGQSDEPAELDDTSTFGTPSNGETQPLQDLMPSYTSINGASAGVNRDDTGSPVTPEAAD